MAAVSLASGTPPSPVVDDPIDEPAQVLRYVEAAGRSRWRGDITSLREAALGLQTARVLVVPPEPEGRSHLLDPESMNPNEVLLEESVAILADPETWTNGRADGFVILSPADHAPSSDFRQRWLDAVEPPQ